MGSWEWGIGRAVVAELFAGDCSWAWLKSIAPGCCYWPSFMAVTCVELFAVALGLSLRFRCSPLVSFALKRAKHRSHAWPKRRPCLSVSSLGAVPRVARSTGHRCGFSHRIASGEHGFGDFCQDKSYPRHRRGSLCFCFRLKPPPQEKRQPEIRDWGFAKSQATLPTDQRTNHPDNQHCKSNAASPTLCISCPNGKRTAALANPESRLPNPHPQAT